MQTHPTPVDERAADLFSAKTKLRDALALLPARHIAAEALPRAAVLAREAADLLEQEFEQRALDTARKVAGFDPDAVMYDVLGRKRSPAAMPGYAAGRAPANKGRTFPPDPPKLDEILALLNACSQDVYGQRLYALILILWRTGMRISEALRITETDLHPDGGYINVKRSKQGKGGEAGIDDWVWPLLEPWLAYRRELPPGPLFCVVDGSTAGKSAWASSAIRAALQKLAAAAGVRRRCPPHQFRHALSVELMIEGKSLVVLQRQLGHANLQVTTIYTRGLPQKHVIDEIRGRPMPTMPAFGVPARMAA